MRFHLETTDDARRARRALGTLAWVPLALAFVWVGTELAYERLWAAERDGSLDSDRLLWWQQFLGMAFGACVAVAITAIGLVTARLPLRPRFLPALTATAFGLLLAKELATDVALAALAFDTFEQLQSVMRFLHPLAWVLLAATLYAAGPRGPRDLSLAAAAAVVPVGLQLLYWLSGPGNTLPDWLAPVAAVWVVVHGILTFAQMGALAMLARRAATTLPTPIVEDDWQTAATGLHRFASAVVARVAIVTTFALLVTLAAMSRSLGMSKLFLLLMSIGSLASSAVAAAGMAGFAHLPQLESVRRGARAVFVLLVASVLADALSVQVALHFVFGDISVLDIDPELFRQAEMAAQLAALAAALLILVGLRNTAGHIGRPELGARATSLIAPVLVLLGGSIAFREWAMTADIGRDIAAILTLVATVGSLVITLAFAKLTHRVAGAMSDTSPPSPARASYRESRSG